MTTIKIRKIGNSLGIILPKEVQDTLNVSEGDFLDLIQIGEGKAVLESHLPHHSHWKFKGADEKDPEWVEADLEDEEDHVSKW